MRSTISPCIVQSKNNQSAMKHVTTLLIDEFTESRDLCKVREGAKLGGVRVY